jgi:hypothetical protein
VETEKDGLTASMMALLLALPRAQCSVEWMVLPLVAEMVCSMVPTKVLGSVSSTAGSWAENMEVQWVLIVAQWLVDCLESEKVNETGPLTVSESVVWLVEWWASATAEEKESSLDN